MKKTRLRQQTQHPQTGLVLLVIAASALAQAQNRNSTSEVGHHRPRSPETQAAQDREAKRLHTIQIECERLIDAGDNAGAERKARAGIATTSDPGPLERVLAEALLRQRKDREALALLKKISPYGFSDESRARVGLLLVRLGDVDESLTELKDAAQGPHPIYASLKDLPALDDARDLEGAWLLAIGRVESLKGQSPTARYYLEQAFRFFPRDARLNYNLGDYYLMDQDFKRAESAYTRARDYGEGDLKGLAIDSLRFTRRAERAAALEKAKAPPASGSGSPPKG